MEAQHKLAKKVFDEYLKHKSLKEYIDWMLGEDIYKLKQNGLYKFVFGENDDREEYSWTSFWTEEGTPLSTIDYRESIYKKWIVELGYSVNELKNIHGRKLHRAIPYAKDKKVSQSILEQARILTFNDFIDFLKEL